MGKITRYWTVLGESGATDVCRYHPSPTVLLVRDGTPLPGQTPAQLLSQLAHRVLGPLRPHRIRAVLDHHGLRDAPAAGQAEIAAGTE